MRRRAVRADGGTDRHHGLQLHHLPARGTSALSTIALVPRAGLTVTGELKGYEYAGDSGGRLEINFCPNCGSPVLLNIRAKPDIVSIKVGSFDDTSWFKPSLSIWADSAQAWMPELPDCKSFPGNMG